MTYGEPENWDIKTHGPCASLPVCKIVTEDARFIHSWWKPTFIERIYILLGWKIRLTVAGTAMPPVAFLVDNQKETK